MKKKNRKRRKGPCFAGKCVTTAVHWGAAAVKMGARQTGRALGAVFPCVRPPQKMNPGEYIRAHKRPAKIVVKMPGPSLPKSGSAAAKRVNRELGRVLSEAGREAEDDNLTILNLDNYFRKLK